MDAVAQRDRALRRLSRLTTSAGIAGVAATIGFGGLAAATYTGHSAPAPDQITTFGDSTTGSQQAAPTVAPVSGRRSSRSSGSVTPPRRSFGGGGQITSGGSG